MDAVTLGIIVAIGIVIAVIILILVYDGKDKSEDSDYNQAQQVSMPAKQSDPMLNTNMDIFGDENDMQNKMQAEETELLTKYTAGNNEGIQEVEKLLEGDPNNVDLLDWLAFMYYSNGNIDKAIETYKRALANKPDNENQHYYLGNSYYKKNMFLEAKKCWSEVIRLKPASKIAKNAQERIDFLKSKGK